MSLRALLWLWGSCGFPKDTAVDQVPLSTSPSARAMHRANLRSGTTRTSRGPTRPSARCCTWPRAIPESWIHPGRKRPSELSVCYQLPGCRHTSRTAFGWALGLSCAHAHSQQGCPEGSSPRLCLCPCGRCPGMSSQQKVLERAQAPRVSPLQALLLQCTGIFPVLEWADGSFLKPPK